MKSKVSFTWKNYTRPTPTNLKRIMEFWKGLFVLLTSGSIFADADKWVSIGILVTGYILDRLVKFFAYVEEQESKKEVKIEVKAESSESV